MVPADIVGYYRNPAVLARILEFLGVPSSLLQGFTTGSSGPLADSPALKELLCAATTEYISAYGYRLLKTIHKDHIALKSFKLGWALDNTLDIHRSIWDRENALGVLDVEYFSKNFPGEPYLAPEQTFRLMEPIYQCILKVFKLYGLSPLVVTTGQGYNFNLSITKDKPSFADLVALGHVETMLQYDYSHPSHQRGRPVSREDAGAFDAMGKLFEFLCQQILSEAAGLPHAIPLVAGDLVCGNEKREAVSLDLSLYINPIHTRSIRCPFSLYSKHMLRGDVLGEVVARDASHFFCIPRKLPGVKVSLKRMLNLRTSVVQAARWAEKIVTTIPDQSQAFANLIMEYKRSALYAFHQEYDASEQDQASAWEQGYDRLDLASLPPCVARPLGNPNPLLLQPTNLRTVVRTLLALGWHPKHIAGLIYSKYARDFGWEVNFARYDANRWANVWVRIYAGMIATGVDRLLDFNCISHQEKGEAWAGMNYCPSPYCGYNLDDFRKALQRKI